MNKNSKESDLENSSTLSVALREKKNNALAADRTISAISFSNQASLLFYLWTAYYTYDLHAFNENISQ